MYGRGALYESGLGFLLVLFQLVKGFCPRYSKGGDCEYLV